MADGAHARIDFGEIIRSAGSIAWRYKTLWWLGLFAGTAGGNIGSSYRWDLGSPSSGSDSFENAFAAPFARLIDTWAVWLPWVLGAAALLMAVWIVFLILQVAAQGGLISQVDLAERGYRPYASAGWSEGFARWWRIAGIEALAFLPALLLGMIFAIAMVVVLVPLIAGDAPSSGAIIGLLVGGLALAFIAIPVSIFLGILAELAMRHAVLEEASIGDAFGRAWWLFRNRLGDVLIMWLLAAALGFAFALVLGVAALAIGVFIALLIGGLFAAGLASDAVWPLIAGAIAVGIPLAAVFVAASAAFVSFRSALWTLFWRRATGRHQPAGPPVGYGQPAWPAPVPPQPGWPSAPPAPPAPPAPSQSAPTPPPPPPFA